MFLIKLVLYLYRIRELQLKIAEIDQQLKLSNQKLAETQHNNQVRLCFICRFIYELLT